MPLSRVANQGLTGPIGGRRNVIINGAQQVAQRATSVADVGGAIGYFVTDRMNLSNGGLSGRLTMSQDSDSPDGFANSLKFDCTTAQTSFDAADFCWFQTRIEGQDLQRFAKGTSSAKNFTFSFYVKANSARTMIAELFDADNTRAVSKTFTTTTDWSRIEIDFGADTTGAFDDDGNLSLYVALWLASGSTYNGGTLQTSWVANNNANRNVGGSNFFSSTDNTLFITGMQLEVGSVATEFEHRSFGEELALCQRYYRRMQRADGSDTANTIGRGIACTRIGIAQTQSSTIARCIIEFPVTMRTTPTLEVSAVADIDYVVGTSSPAATDFTTTSDGVSGAMVSYTNSGGGLTTGQAARLQFNATDKFIAFDAEL